MGIQRRSLNAIEFNRVLQRTCPQKLQLIRYHPYNCVGGTCFQNGRNSISGLCPVCGGTGYLPSQASSVPNFPPNSDSYFIYGDVQSGHGLYGFGGDYLRLIADIGKQIIGDATLFTKFFDVDRKSGKTIYPKVDAAAPRPDQIISLHGILYNVVREIIVEIGSEDIARVFTCERGSFSPISSSNRA